MAFTQVPLTGTVILPDGSAGAGALVRLTLSTPVTDGSSFVMDEPITARCGPTGSMSVTVNANDDTTTTPTGSYYEVTVTYGSLTIDSFNVVVPKASSGGVDLFSLAHLPAPPSLGSPYVSSFMGRNGAITLETSDLPSSVVTDSWLAINVLDKKYGAKGDGVTDDTDAIQGALNAAGTAARTNGDLVDVVLPSGYGFKFEQIQSPNQVRIRAVGATIIPNWASNTGPLITAKPGAAPLNGFEIIGGSWQGTGAENNDQVLFGVGDSGGNAQALQRAKLIGMEVSNWAVGPFMLTNPYRVHVLGNRLLNVGSGPGYVNAICFQQSLNTYPIGELFALYNLVENAMAGAIAYVAPDATAATTVRAVFALNILSGAASGGNDVAGAIDLENPTTNMITGFTIAGNNIYCPATNGFCINAGNNSQGNYIGGVKVHGNRLTGGNVGVHAAVTDLEVVGNTILTPYKIGGPAAPRLVSGNSYSSAGPSQGRAVLAAGTVTVDTAEVVAPDNIILTRVLTGGTVGDLSVGTIVSGTSFVINSSSTTDTSTVYWRIDH